MLGRVSICSRVKNVFPILTGALGEMTTLGAMGKLCLAGVLCPPMLVPLPELVPFIAGG